MVLASEHVPSEKEFNHVVYRLAQVFKGHGEDDEGYARNEASAHRRNGNLARVVKLRGTDGVVRWCVYTRERDQ